MVTRSRRRNRISLARRRWERRRSPRSWSTGDPTSSWPIRRRRWSPRDGRPAPSPSCSLPVAQGFVQSLARPGGNITGFGSEEPSMGAKWVQLLSEIVPRLQSITVIFNPDSAPFARMFLPAIEAVRATSAFELTISPISQRDRTRPCHRGRPPAIQRPDRSTGQLP